jgi:DNA-binding NarL/FixJ family response regulator
VVLANRPTAAECNQMLSFGATACLSKETEARDVINAIHLASRGMHVLPRSAAAGGASTLDVIGSELLTRREAEVLESAARRGHQRADRVLPLDRGRDGAHPRAR